MVGKLPCLNKGGVHFLTLLGYRVSASVFPVSCWPRRLQNTKRSINGQLRPLKFWTSKTLLGVHAKGSYSAKGRVSAF